MAEPDYARHTTASGGRAGLPLPIPPVNHRNLDRRTSLPTTLSRPSRNSLNRGGQPRRNQRQSQIYDRTPVTPRDVDNTFELGNSLSGTPVHEVEGDHPSPRTQQVGDPTRENIQEIRGRNTDPGPQVVIEAPSLSPVSGTEIAVPPPLTGIQPEEPIENGLQGSNLEPEPESVVEIGSTSSRVATPTETPPSDPPSPPQGPTESTDRGNNGQHRYLLEKAKDRLVRDRGRNPIKEGQLKVDPSIVVKM
jgi:hypothetical protein